MIHKVLLILILVSLSVFAVSAQDTDELEESIVSVANVLWMDDLKVIENGEAVLTRMKHGLSVTFTTAELDPNHVYTLWWIIMDEPENCTNNTCSFDDIFLMDEDGRYILDEDELRQPNFVQRELVMISNLSGHGTIGLEDGTAVFRAHLPIGDLSGANLFGPGLHNPMSAEVHIIIRTHGPAIPEILAEQLMEPWGGCPDRLDRSPCEDIQVAFFYPPSQQ